MEYEEIADKIRRLEREHATLDSRIAAMTKTGIYSDMQLQELKRKKLRVKDQLRYLRRAEYEDSQVFDVSEDY